MKGNINLDTDPKEAFFIYLGLTATPMFNWFSSVIFIEDQTQTGTENFVIIGTEVAKNTFITSRVMFTKNGEGYYKLDLLTLLKINERLLYQSFNQYYNSLGYVKIEKSRTYYGKSNMDVPKDKLLHYLEIMHELDNSLKQIRYNPSIKVH